MLSVTRHRPGDSLVAVLGEVDGDPASQPADAGRGAAVERGAVEEGGAGADRNDVRRLRREAELVKHRRRRR